MKILDLFCCIGGSARGIKKAFPNADLLGIDVVDYSKSYPFRFMRLDITKLSFYLIDSMNMNLIWASPPCQNYSFSTRKAKNDGIIYPDLVEFTRNLLDQTHLPYVIENVVGSPLIKEKTILLYGDMFNIPTKRPRKFEIHGIDISKIELPKRNRSLENYRLISGGGGWIREGENVKRMTLEMVKELYGIEDVTMKEASQIVIPQMAEFIMNQFKIQLFNNKEI
jgi:DNA (cytosine-5)-methyltransferase 1